MVIMYTPVTHRLIYRLSYVRQHRRRSSGPGYCLEGGKKLFTCGLFVFSSFFFFFFLTGNRTRIFYV